MSIAGLGFGLIYLPAIVTVGYYFEKRRAFGTGLAVCGSGLGALIFNPFSKYLIDTYSWRRAFLIEAGIILNFVLCGALFRALMNKKKRKTFKKKRELRENALKSLKDAIEMELFITSDKPEGNKIVANGNISEGQGDIPSLAVTATYSAAGNGVVKPKLEKPEQAPDALFSSDGALNKWQEKRNEPLPISPLAQESKPPQFQRLSSVEAPRQRHNHHQLVPDEYFILKLFRGSHMSAHELSNL